MSRRIPTATDDRWADDDRRAEDDPWGRHREGAGRRGIFLGSVRVTPVRVVLLIALIGTLAYVAYAILGVRDTSQIPMLASGAAVLGVVFLALAVAGGQGTLVAGREGRNRDALLLGLGGGISAIIGFGAFAGAIILALVWRAG